MSELTPETAFEIAPGLTPLLPVAAEVTVVHPFRERYWLHALLLLATIFTTLTVGAGMQFNFQHNFAPYSADENAAPFFPLEWVLQHPARLALGIPFSATLLLILLCHEMGHYLYCLRYRVWASLPYFIPFPSLAGTMGAFIRIRSAIRSRTALFDIGIAGPIAGFVPALAALFVGLSLSKPLPSSPFSSEIEFGHPLIFGAAQRILGTFVHAPVHLLALERVDLHPIAFAAWVGMVVTSLNLLPGGQLDGGHIIYAVFPRGHRWITLLTVGVLIPMGLQSMGWWLWAVVLLATGWRHPPVPPWPGLNGKRKLLALLMVGVLLAAITPVPVKGFSAAEAFPSIFARHWRQH
jgi:membrane-associated protease RseP (regulator of RpoE activity)